MDTRSLWTVKQFAERHPAFTESALRALIFQASPRESSKGKVAGNGLAPAIIRLGGRVLIDERRFFEWIDEQQQGRAA